MQDFGPIELTAEADKVFTGIFQRKPEYGRFERVKNFIKNPK